ncbi:hypothetical protein N3K63_09000 [Microbacterium sp. W1N]|uniref:hypothetical protein n=1 Tax=Microbacterium festucae TaxID=2977531 RepID=UPI0021BEC635|nr:hypothetical protein [Microbacterium festucae]MCT9820416.1 hypothetical protein [Microbacterium festucae]
MGIFQQRPEDQNEWAGLPSEPWEPRADAEVLPPAVDDLGLFAAGTSVSVPLEVREETLDDVIPDPDAPGTARTTGVEVIASQAGAAELSAVEDGD